MSHGLNLRLQPSSMRPMVARTKARRAANSIISFGRCVRENFSRPSFRAGFAVCAQVSATSCNVSVAVMVGCLTIHSRFRLRIE
jgi:hypothetical protein